MHTPGDWRLTNQEKYLKGVALTWRNYEPTNKANDHDHCEFCGCKFMTYGPSNHNTLNEGFSTDDGYRWVCKSCFDDFLGIFEWKVDGPTKIQLKTST